MTRFLFISILTSFGMYAQGPSVDSMNPVNGSSAAQQLVHFTAQVSSPHGAGFIKRANISFDSGPGSLPGCQILFQDNQLFLISDSGISYAGSAFIGGSNSISNSKCTVDAAHSAVTMSENTLKLDIAVMFLGSTANYQVRLLAGDRDGGNTVNADSSGFKMAGSWNVLPAISIPPTVGSTTACPGPATAAFTGCYFNNLDLSGSPALVRKDSSINFSWGTGSPDRSVSAVDFSARWQGIFNFDQGTYTFNATTSDGMRVFIDGNPVMYRWRDQSTNSYRFMQELTQGNHLVTVEYYNHTGSATAMLSWQKQ